MPDFTLSRFLPFRLNRLADRLSRQIMPIYRDAQGIGRAEWRVMAHLGADDGATASQLVTLTALDKVRVSRACAALESRGWISRRPDRQDRRAQLVTLTPQGRAALDGLTPDMLAAESALLAQLTPDQQHRLAQVLDDLEQVLGLSGGPTDPPA
ncbi:MarR family winged helix-turn-helix transcriptional regulator [Paracoccus jiaweipingae]|uniref:MarR family winged helix-turn-helix transcriptional regulator n=1 Tax=unclassified Paracoccus (in: a-proteobacteria) TaxID=2688777 RepID=UPI003796DC55